MVRFSGRGIVMRSGVVATIILLSGCVVAPPTGPDIAVMPGSGKNLAQFQQDDASCRQYANGMTNGASPSQAANQSALGQCRGGRGNRRRGGATDRLCRRPRQRRGVVRSASAPLRRRLRPMHGGAGQQATRAATASQLPDLRPDASACLLRLSAARRLLPALLRLSTRRHRRLLGLAWSLPPIGSRHRGFQIIRTRG